MSLSLRLVLPSCFLVLSSLGTFAQAPTITAVSPAPNAVAAARTSTVSATFSHSLTAGSVGALKVFSSQRGGLRTRGATPAVVSGSTLRFTPSDYSFLPGETVFSTITRAAASSGGTLAQPRVMQFTAATGGTGEGNFQPGTNPTTGASPGVVAVGDVDGDGDLDLLVTNANGTVSVRLNDGTGAYTGSQQVAVGAGPNSLKLADVDGDGDLDFVTVSSNTNTLSVRLNNGAGLFGGGQELNVPENPVAVAIADINGDGDLDLLTGNSTGLGSVSLRLNNGAGVFSPGANVSVRSGVRSITTGDLDNDGDVDLLTTYYSNNTSGISVRFNNGAGTFSGTQEVGAGFRPGAAALGDVDNDGDLDLLVADAYDGPGGNIIIVRLNNGSGLFGNPLNLPTGRIPISVLPADVDSDGDLDLLSVNTYNGPNGNKVTVYLNGGAGLFSSSPEVAMSPSPRGMALGDVDGDGDVDLLVASPSDNTVSVRLNQPALVPTLRFGPASASAGTTVTVTGTNLSGISVFTLNGVAMPLASISNSTATGFTFVVPPGLPPTGISTVTATAGTGTSAEFTTLLLVSSTNPPAHARAAPIAGSAVALTFTEPVTTASAQTVKVFSSQAGGQKAGALTVSGSTARFAATAGTPFTNFRPGEVVSVSVPATVQSVNGVRATRKVFQFSAAVSGTGQGQFLPGPASAPIGGINLDAADLDGDGDLDMVAVIHNFGLNILFNDGTGAFGLTRSLTIRSEVQDVAPADVDGDGDIDLVTVNFTFSWAEIRLNNGTGTFGQATLVSVGRSPVSVTTGDLDGDGDLDLLTANYSDNTVSVRFNNGTGTFSGSQEVPVGAIPYEVAVGDVDNDGDLDLLAANRNAGTVSVRFNDGAGRFSGTQNVPVGNYPRSIALGDIDADGDLDLVTNSGLNSGGASIRLNDGAGLFSGTQTLTALRNTEDVALGDVDGDGDLDLVVAGARYVDRVAVYLNDGAGSFSGGGQFFAGTTEDGLTLGDMDGDGDLDVLLPAAATVYLNQPLPVTITRFSPASAPAGATVTVTGTNLSGITALTINGAVVPLASIRNNTATGFTFVVPAGATLTGTSTVTTARTTGSSTGFTAQLSIFGISPSPNSIGIPVVGAGRPSILFSEPVTSASAQNIRVYSAQGGGRKAGTVTVSGNTASFTATAGTPHTNFKPGELVRVSVPATVQSGGGIGANKHVFQFTTAVGGTGRGNFQPGSNVTTGPQSSEPLSVAAADVDGDGDLDMLAANTQSSTVSIRLNGGDATGSNTGTFSGTQEVAVSAAPFDVAVGDVDGDGDLDFVTANYTFGVASVRLNGGDATGSNTGLFSGTQNVAVGTGPVSVALADIDGDGDLDILVANSISNSVSLRLNNGTGLFSGTLSVAVGTTPFDLAVGDVDSDGDLDLLTANSGSGTVSVRLNISGSGFFNGTQDVAVGTATYGVAVGDVDGDGDLDLAATNLGGNAVSLRLNDGLSTFGGTQSIPVGSNPVRVTMGDVDSDGDLDLVSANDNSGVASVRLNSGTGLFSNGPDAALTFSRREIALADLDGDGDLDMMVGIAGGNFVSVRLNQILAPSISSFAPNPAPVGATVTLTGTNLAGATALTVNGAAAVITTNTGTSLSFVVPAGAAVTGTTTVTTAGGPASSTAFRVQCSLPVAAAQNVTLTLGTDGTAILLASVLNNGSTADCGPAPAAALRVSAASFTCTNLGANQVTLTVTDSQGNTSTATATVTVVRPATLVTTWNGAVSTDWTDCRNWSFGQVPDAATEALIPAGLPRYPLLAAGTQAVGRLQVASGASLSLAAGATLDVFGDWQNDGTLTLAGAVSFRGGAAQRLGGSSLSTFAQLTVNKTGGTLTLERNATVTSTLTLTAGLLTTATHELTTTGATLTESEISYVLGTVRSVADVDTAGTRYSFGNLGLSLTPAAGASLPGLTTVRRVTGTALTGQGSSVSIRRYYDVRPATNAGLNVALELSYLDAELNGIPEAELALFRSAAGPAGPWERLLASGRDLQANTVTAAGLTQLSLLTLGQQSNPLPTRAPLLATAPLRVYPNPARTNATVVGAPAGATVQVLDALGRVVTFVTADATGTVQLALPTGLTAGVYVVRSGSQMTKLLVE